jgi:hypothetical protein
MKAPKILIAGLLALSTAVTSQAQTVIHLTGSTAFRSAVHTAITQILQPGFTYAYTGTSFGGANNAIFTGTAKTNGISVIIKTSWSGSLAGIETVSQAHVSTQSGFLTNTTTQSTGGTANAPTNFDPAVIPEVCMNDGYQYDSQYPTPALVGTPVGVVVFKFLKSPSVPADVSNLNPLEAQQFWGNGQIPASLLSGNPSDSNTVIYAIGRDPDSGTRKTAFLETGVQQFNSFLSPAQVLQYEPLAGGNQVNRGNEAPATAQVAWPAETVDDINFTTGDAGYASGGDLAVAVGENSPNFPYITYLGLSDARSAEGLGAVDLSYNGVAFSDAAVENGTYTYWTYEFLSYNQSSSPLAPSANVKAVADLLAQTITSQTLNGPSGVGENLSAMNVQRGQEGGQITLK